MVHHISVLPDDVLQVVIEKVESTENVTGDSLRFVRLPHPRTGIRCLFLPYQTSTRSGILEIQSVAPPNPRSWFMPSDEVVEDGKLLVMTPVDPAFILISILRCLHQNGNTPNFRTAEDLFEEAAPRVAQTIPADDSEDTIAVSTTIDIIHLLHFTCVLHAMQRICDYKEIAPGVTVYRYSFAKVQDYLKAKVERLSTSEVSTTSRTITRDLAKDGLLDDGNDSLLALGRIRAACDLVSQYVPPDVYATLIGSYDFTILHFHLKQVQEERGAIAASKMDKFEEKESKNKGSDRTGEKKRKAAKGSHGVEKLKKANTTGMAKISSFFQKPSK